MQKQILAGFTALAILLLPVGALAQGAPCLPRAGLAQVLEGIGEAPVGRSLTSKGNMVELFATPDFARWSIVATGPNGCSALVAEGKDWQMLWAAIGDPA